MKNIKIRRAVVGDEVGISKVHIQSWQEAYKGLLPQAYLDQLPSELSQRIENWKKSLVHSDRWTFVAEGDKGIIGFILFGPPREPSKAEYIELGAFYILAAYKGQGIGFRLLQAGFQLMRELGYQRAYCWVLETNPTIQFYEKNGAVFSGQVRDDEVAGEIFVDRIYQWESLNLSR